MRQSVSTSLSTVCVCSGRCVVGLVGGVVGLVRGVVG